MNLALTTTVASTLLFSGVPVWAQNQAQRTAVVVSSRVSLQAAIEQARDGDTVVVQGPAVFHEHLVVNKSIRIIGTNSPIVDGDGTGTSLILAAADTEVRGITVRNSGCDLANFDCAILIMAPRVAVRDCRIESGAFGVYVRGVNDCVVESNKISGDAGIPSAQRGNGIHLWKTRGDLVTGNEIHDKRDGIYLSYADNSLIGGNRVWDTRFGIHYMYSHENRLLTNSLTHNVVGAALMFSRKLVVEGNVAVANRRHGIVLKQLDSSQILRNVVAGQNRGFFAQQANQNHFEGNLIATNDIGLYLSSGSEQNVFVGNAFVRNTDQIWQPPFEARQGQKGPNAFSENGRGNYWSDYTGADRNNDGIGDTPYHETDVFGYIVDRHSAARVLAMSPAIALLRKGEELMPLMDTTGVTDRAPLVNPERVIVALARK